MVSEEDPKENAPEVVSGEENLPQEEMERGRCLEAREEDFKECEPDKYFVVADLFRPYVIFKSNWPEYAGKFKTLAEFQEFYWDRFTP